MKFTFPLLLLSFSGLFALDAGARREDDLPDLSTGTTLFPPETDVGHPNGPGSHGAIVPGTKWCGAGNVASSYDDLGYKRETDKCCRTHDHCPYYIPSLSYKYNHNNLHLYTLSWCPCDMELFNCLKAVNTTSSKDVGEMFFGVLGVDCFDFQIGRYCAEQYYISCDHWVTGPMAVTHEFPKSWDSDPDTPIGK